MAMKWYYAEGDERKGPLDEAELKSRVQAGTLRADTMVWHEGMQGWAPYNTLSQGTAAPSQSSCSECGKAFPASEMVAFGNSMVCASCKPAFFQRVKEGGQVAGHWVFGGFWVRVVAKVMDGFIQSIPGWILALVLGVSASAAAATDGEMTMALVLVQMVSWLVPIVYTTFFIGKYGATPGKMALGLKVIRSDGSSLTYMRAFGRYFAEILSALILMIGYFMAAWDQDKRCLHDRICDTRVVRK